MRKKAGRPSGPSPWYPPTVSPPTHGWQRLHNFRKFEGRTDPGSVCKWISHSWHSERCICNFPKFPFQWEVCNTNIQKSNNHRISSNWLSVHKKIFRWHIYKTLTLVLPSTIYVIHNLQWTWRLEKDSHPEPVSGHVLTSSRIRISSSSSLAFYWHSKKISDPPLWPSRLTKRRTYCPRSVIYRYVGRQSSEKWFTSCRSNMSLQCPRRDWTQVW